MSKYIEVPVTLELSGYSRGHVEGRDYYDPETKKLVDWDYDISTYDIVRNDMEVYEEIPRTLEE